MGKLLNPPLRILLKADFLVLVAAAMILPYYSSYVAIIGGSLLDAGVGAGVFAVFAAVASLIAGVYADGIKKKSSFVALGYLGMAIGFLAMGFLRDTMQLMIVQAFIGLVSASYQPAYDALFTEHIGSRKKASSRWAVWESTNHISIAIGAILGAVIVDQFGFLHLFIATMIICLCSAAYLGMFRSRYV